MEVLYSSTRNGEPKFTASQAILKGLADDGGLFVPDHIPALSCSMRDLSGKSYQEVYHLVLEQCKTGKNGGIKRTEKRNAKVHRFFGKAQK